MKTDMESIHPSAFIIHPFDLRWGEGRTDKTGMILDDPTAMSVLKAVYQAAAGPAGPIVRRDEVAQFTSLDPAAIQDAIDALLDAKLLLPGVTDDRICLSRAGSACVQGFVQRRAGRVA